MANPRGNPENLKRVPKGGPSPNPSGRPATLKHWRDQLAKFMEEEGLAELFAISRDRKHKDQAKCLMWLGEQVYGRATTVIAGPEFEDNRQPLLIRIVERKEPSENHD
jgi:hypothetical protein